MDFILDQPCIPSSSRPTKTFIITKSFSYFFSYFFLRLFLSFFNKLSSPGRFPSFSQACSVPHQVYLVIPQAGTRCQRACLVPRWVNLLNSFSIRGSCPNVSTPYRYLTNKFSYEGVVGEQIWKLGYRVGWYMHWSIASLLFFYYHGTKLKAARGIYWIKDTHG